MKRRVIAMLLVVVMAMSGCAKEAKDKSGSVVEAGQTKDVNEQKTKDVNEQKTKDVNEQSGVTASFSAGGKPWINSDLKENLSENNSGSMELSAKADFHLYVNYEWLKNAQIPAGMESVSTFSEAQDEIQEKLHILMTDESIQGHEAELVRDYYSALTDEEARNNDGVRPLQRSIDEIKEIANLDELSNYICDANRNEIVPVFLDFSNVYTSFHKEAYSLLLVNDKLLLNNVNEYRDRTNDGEKLYEAQKYLAKEILGRCGYSKEEAEQMYDHTIELETDLLDKVSTKELMANINIHQLVATGYRKFPFERLLKEQGYLDANSQLVLYHQYLENLDNLYTEKNLDRMKEYMIVKAALNAAPILDMEAFEAYNTCLEMADENNKRMSLEEYSVEQVRYWLNAPLTRAFVEKYNCVEEKERITKLIMQCIDEYRKMLKEEDWLQKKTKQNAIEKLDCITVRAVYPDKWEDYSSLDLNYLSLWDSNRVIQDFIRKKDRKKTNQEYDKNTWDQDSFVANAQYRQADNSITILLGVLGGDIYYEGIPDEELYAGIGSVICHEISHAFDSNGCLYDKDGYYRKWWTEEDQQELYKKLAKLQAYYKQIYVWKDAPVNAEIICSEAIADMGSMKNILRIAKDHPDFDYDLFFRSYARLWRTVRTLEYETMAYEKDAHPAAYLRTNVVLQQFDEFYKTYDIKKGDNMYLAPKDRILVW